MSSAAASISKNEQTRRHGIEDKTYYTKKELNRRLKGKDRPPLPDWKGAFSKGGIEFRALVANAKRKAHGHDKENNGNGNGHGLDKQNETDDDLPYDDDLSYSSTENSESVASRSSSSGDGSARKGNGKGNGQGKGASRRKLERRRLPGKGKAGKAKGNAIGHDKEGNGIGIFKSYHFPEGSSEDSVSDSVDSHHDLRRRLSGKSVKRKGHAYGHEKRSDNDDDDFTYDDDLSYLYPKSSKSASSTTSVDNAR